jgi:hypothetical protein
MLRRIFPTPTDDALDETAAPSSTGGAGDRTPEPDLTSLPIAGITRRRMATLLGVLLAAWIVVIFARQVSEASAATGRAQAMIATNADRRAQVAGLERELEQVQQRPFILQQARAYGLGASHEIPFSLAPGAPSLDPNAPGSAAVRLGSRTSASPLEHWLSLLFGPGS